MPRQCRLADVVESQMSSLEGFDIERVLWEIYGQVPKVNALSGFTIFFYQLVLLNLLTEGIADMSNK